MPQWDSPEASRTPISTWEGQGGLWCVHRSIIPGLPSLSLSSHILRLLDAAWLPLSGEWPILPCTGVPADHKCSSCKGLDLALHSPLTCRETYSRSVHLPGPQVSHLDQGPSPLTYTVAMRGRGNETQGTPITASITQ